MTKAGAPIVCAMVAATYWTLEPVVDQARDGWLKIFAADLLIAIVAVVTLVAIAGLLAREGGKVLRRESGRMNAAVVLVAFAVTFVVGVATGPAGESFVWIFDHVYAPLESSLLALVAFALVDTALRRMRARSGETALLIATAAIVLLGRAPVSGAAGTLFTPVADWLTRVPNVAGQRVLLIGAAIAACATLLRLLLGIERDYLGERRS